MEDHGSAWHHDAVTGIGSETKGWLAFLVLASLVLSFTACGGAVKDGQSSAQRYSKTTAPVGSAALPMRLRGDEDDDDENSETFNPHNSWDGDADRDHDYDENVINGYYDKDDNIVRGYGHAPSPPEQRALIAFVKGYFGAGAAEDGATACSMIIASISKAIPEDYGSGAGPSYLRGKTCAVVMGLLFKHLHGQMTAPITVSAVRVRGNEARIVVGSPATPVSYLPMKRERGAWKLIGLIGTPLP